MNDFNCVISHIAPPQITSGGDFVYRLNQPDAALGAIPGVVTVSATNIYTERLALIENASVLIIQLLGDPDLLPVIEKRRAAGLPTIFEISDNFLDFQPSNPAARFYNVPENRSCILHLISICDAVQVTVPALADKFRRFNPNIAVFENRMQSTGDPKKKEEETFVFGWGGSAGHYEDIKEIAPEIIDFVTNTTGVVFSLMADENFKKLFEALPEDRFRYRAPGTLHDYYEFIQTLHAGIAPLRDDGFNSCRSDVKFMEYASRGAVPVCADTPTYNRTLRDGETGLLFKTSAEMTSHIARLADDPAYRKKLAGSAFEYITNERMEKDGAEERLAFYRKISGDEIPGGNISLEDVKTLKSLVRTPGTRHYLHEMSDAEVFLYNGMVAASSGAQFKEISAIYDKALSVKQDYFMAHFMKAVLCLGVDNNSALCSFDRAIEIWPQSCESRLRKALLLHATGKKEEAGDLLSAVKNEYPGYEQAIFFQAQFLFENEKKQEARTLLEETLAVNRWHIPAMTQLAAMDLEAGDFDSALNGFKHAVELAPGMKTAKRGLAVAQLENGMENDAASTAIDLIEDDSSDLMALSILLRACKGMYKKGNVEEAAEFLEMGMGLRPDNAEIVFWRLRCLKRAEKNDEAEKLALLLKEVDKENRYDSYY